MRYDSPWTSHDLVKLRMQSDFKLDTYSVNVELLDFDCWVVVVVVLFRIGTSLVYIIILLHLFMHV